MIDVVGPVGLQIAQGIIAEGGQVDDGVEALQIRGLHVSNVLAESPDAGGLIRETTVFEEEAVEAYDVVSCVLQDRHHHRSDIAVVTRH
jgi:hypothetical protein